MRPAPTPDDAHPGPGAARATGARFRALWVLAPRHGARSVERRRHAGRHEHRGVHLASCGSLPMPRARPSWSPFRKGAHRPGPGLWTRGCWCGGAPRAGNWPSSRPDADTARLAGHARLHLAGGDAPQSRCLRCAPKTTTKVPHPWSARRCARSVMLPTAELSAGSSQPSSSRGQPGGDAIRCSPTRPSGEKLS